MPGMTKTLVGIIGAGGFAREVMPIARDYILRNHTNAPDAEVKLVFVETTPSAEVVNGHEILSEEEFCSYSEGERLFNIAIGSSQVRKDIGDRLMARGCQPISVFGSRSRMYDANELGVGATICDNVIITSNAKIGVFFQANIYSYVAHDCVIGDYVTFAPRVSCNGNVRIEDFAYIGTGAVIKQGEAGKPLVIGKGAVVGMGAVVTKNVAPYTTVVGNPARVLEKK